jgi:hypothetical protein
MTSTTKTTKTEIVEKINAGLRYRRNGRPSMASAFFADALRGMESLGVAEFQFRGYWYAAATVKGWMSEVNS